MAFVSRRVKNILLLRCTFIGVILWSIPYIFDRYGDTTFPFIASHDIEGKLVSNDGPVGTLLCPIEADRDSNQIPLSDTSDYWKDHLQLGGVWAPHSCQGRYKITMIVPYRNRQEHLDLFINYIHRFLQAQNIIYRILIVEQTKQKPFNRGKLLNSGFDYANLMWPDKCFILHDVDLIPQDLRNIYACTTQPRHMWSSLDVFRFHLAYRAFFGGAIAILDMDFRRVNGFSNNYWGWGVEDDDLALRIAAKGVDIVRFDPKVATYTSLRHKISEASNFWPFPIESQNEDGLNTLEYDVLNVTLNPSYTHILVDL